MDENLNGEYTPSAQVNTPSEKNKTGSFKKKMVIFGALTLIVCIITGFFSGAVGSLLVISFYPFSDTAKQEEAAGEKVFVPEYGGSPSYTGTRASAPPETESQALQETQYPTEYVPETQYPSETQYASGINEAQADFYQPETQTPVPKTKTKGEIYASAVNSIVCVEAKSKRSYTGFFGRTYTQQLTSSGSGFFVTEDGYMLTNCHVIEGASEITVTTYDGTRYPAVITGSEKANDIAVLKVEGKFTPADIGDSSTLAVGDDVLVIGNVLGELSYTFTDGVVSYLNRAVSTDSGTVINMFQTNAAINEGNSGGPVYNADGEVVGIASAKYASDAVEGLGFCIPINDIGEIVSDIILCGYVTGKPALGVSVQTVSTSMSYTYNIPTGCYIVAVGAGTAAEKAGLSAGSVITFLDDTRVFSCDDIAAFLSSKKAGDSVSVTGSGSEGEFTVTLTLDEYTPSSPRTNYSNVKDL